MPLQLPPDFPKQSAPIFKCGGEDGCKKVFALRNHVSLTARMLK